MANINSLYRNCLDTEEECQSYSSNVLCTSWQLPETLKSLLLFYLVSSLDNSYTLLDKRETLSKSTMDMLHMTRLTGAQSLSEGLILS